MAEATPTCSKFFLFLVATWFGQLRGGPLRYLGFASSRATKIYGDLAKIYGASPQFFATVSSLSFAQNVPNQCFRNRVSRVSPNERSIEDRVLHAPVVQLMSSPASAHDVIYGKFLLIYDNDDTCTVLISYQKAYSCRCYY